MMMFPKCKNFGRKKKPASPKVSEPESAIQEKAEAYLDAMGFQYIHIPAPMQHWLRTRCPPWIATIASRYLKGIPDLVVFHPNGKYLLLELKTEINDLSQSQESWAKGLKLHCSHGWVESEKILKEFCENP